MRRRAPALLAAVVGGLAGALVTVAAHADTPGPYSMSSATRYQVTFASRSCSSFNDLVAGQVRGDDSETLGRPGRDSAYQVGQPVDPNVEDDLDAGCTDMPGWRFSLGSGHERKGTLSTVTGDPFTTPPTKEWTGRPDSTGRDTGGLLAAAVTVPLTDEQVRLAGRRQLWVQGGTPSQPQPDGYAFGALRCAVDGRTGGNIQWLSFPAGIRHVYCYAYYVKGAGTGGTVTIRMRTTRPIGYPQRVPFKSDLSFAPDSVFALASSGEPVVTSFTRTATPTGAAPYAIQPQPPAGWRVAEVACTASRPDGASPTSAWNVDVPTGTASVTLATGDAVVCAYSLEPPAVPPGLTLRLFSPGAGAAFGVTLAAGAGQPGQPGQSPGQPGQSPGQPGQPGQSPGQQALTVTTGGDGAAVTATGADLTTLASGGYTVTVAPPAVEAAGWTLGGALCNGTAAAVSGMTATINVATGVPLECVLRLTRKPPAPVLNVVTAGDVATAAFAVIPVDTASAGWWAAVNTTGSGTPAAATGDLPPGLPFGAYLITAIPPRSTETSGWGLASFNCTSADRGATAGAAIRVTLIPGGPDPVCTASYRSEPTTRLQVSVQAKGSRFGRHGPAIVEVSCVDGSAGRAVLAADDDGRATLPGPLAFLEPTNCTITQSASGAAQTSMVKVSATLEPAAGDGPLEMPSQVSVSRDVALYTFAVTDEFGQPTVLPDRTSILDDLRALPIALVGIGIVGLGGLVLLGVLLRRRVS
jgi:hypothetical protein